MTTRVRTFLFTDLESSTKAWIDDTAAMQAALARHDEILRQAIEQHEGEVLKHTGDGVVAVFHDPLRAAEGAVAAQLALRADPDGDRLLRSRMGLHTGASEEREGDYFGPTLNRAARIMAAAHGGQVLASEAVASVLDGSVPIVDLGIHRLRDLLEPERVHQIVVDDAAAYPPIRSLDAFDHNLPRQATRLIGREDSLATVHKLLADSRLVTLTGVGGVGKTRLALEAAARELDRRDGVVFVDLAAVSDPALVQVALAAALNLPASESATDLTPVLRPLATRSMLVVLDNCEHLLDASADLVEAILDECPSSAVLATSREPLGLDAEQVWRVPSLSEPAAAIELFVDRAVRVHSEFVLDDATKATVLSICTQLDGIPLAIELAAARVSHLSVAEIDERLGDRFRLLAGGRRRARQRHQTLQAALDWSYDLLDDAERQVLRRAGIFSGGFTLHALEQVAFDEALGTRSILDVLGSLVDRSLVVPRPDESGGGRYSLLETVRLYAIDRLAEAGEIVETRRRHAAWVQEWLGPPPVTGMRPWSGSDREKELDNVLAALDWVDGSDDLAALGRLAVAAQWGLGEVVWIDDQWRYFGRADVEAALTGEERAQYLAVSATTANSLGDFPRQADFAERARQSERGSPTWRLATVTLANALGVLEPPRAEALYAEVIPTVPPDQKGELAVAMSRSADAPLMMLDLELGARRMDDAERVTGIADVDVGFVHLALGRLGRVREAAAAMAKRQEEGRGWGPSDFGAFYRAPLLTGILAAVEGRFEDSAAELIRAARLIERFPIRLVDHDVLTAFAALAHHRGELTHAARLLAIVSAGEVWARTPGVSGLHMHYRKLIRRHVSSAEVQQIRAEVAGTTVIDALTAEIARYRTSDPGS